MKLEGTVPGMVYPSWRDGSMKTAFGYMEGRKTVDGAEGLWRIGNKLYDLESFARNHPGGSEWIRLTKGTDITEIFEAHHITDKAFLLLPKYYVRDVTTTRSVPFTFNPDGFYRTFKKRAREALKGIDYHHSSRKSNLIADFLVATTLLTSILAASTQSYLAVILSGVFLVWTTIIGHNYFHMRDNFRMYYFDLSTMSSKDWRISHAMSHHTYPNTLWDYEVYGVEPFLNWLTMKKTLLGSMVSQVMSPIIWALLIVEQFIKRYYSVFYEYRSFEFRDVVPFVIPVLMTFFAPSVFAAIKTWILLILVTSFFFGLIGFNAAHHHPNIFHNGDIYRNDFDWGLLELDAVRDRKVIDDSDFLVLTNFGQHALHHLLPTVDHTYLPLCRKAFEETCKEFGIGFDKLTQWELVKGQFQQLSRSVSKKNHR